MSGGQQHEGLAPGATSASIAAILIAVGLQSALHFKMFQMVMKKQTINDSFAQPLQSTVSNLKSKVYSL